MATVDLTNGATRPGANASGGMYTYPITLDFSSTSRASADILQILAVPAGTMVICINTNVETAEGGTFTFDVGDAGDVDRFLNGIDGNSAGFVEASTEAGGLAAGGFMYTADDTIDFLLNDAADAARIHIYISVVDHSNILGPTA